LDIKLKSSRSKYIINTVIIFLLIILSAGMYSTYPLIEERAKKYELNFFEREVFLSILNQSNYAIYYDMLKDKEDKTLKPWEVLVDTEKKDNQSSEENVGNAETVDYEEKNMNYIKSDFEEGVYANLRDLDDGLKNLEYYSVNKNNSLVKERNQGGIDVLLADNPDSNTLEALKNKYGFYIVIDYNEKGDMTVKNTYGADKLIETNLLKNYKIGERYNLEIKPIKNMTYIYAVPKELQYTDFISYHKTQNRILSFNAAASDFIAPAIIFILIVGLIIPYKLSKELIGFKKVAKIPIEISAFIFIFTIGVVLNEVSYSMISGTLEEDLLNFDLIVLSEAAIFVLEGLINILFWVVSFGIVFITVVLLKHIWSIGIKQYLKENSLTYKFFRGIWRTNKRIYKYFTNLDLRSREGKKLAGLLGINLIILSVMSSFWFFGILLAIIYTVVLFNIIRKRYNDISIKYNKLFEATNKIAEGNLEVSIDEDLGIFNSFKAELQNIQKGFKKAVNEEVKSQRMKTELITNVSHDLKTPLTSIITYVDLLKDENLPVEKRREYLDTLDRKSQRLKDLIEDLFEVSKATSGNISLNIVDVDVVSLMKQTLLELDDKIAKAALAVRTNYPEEKVILPLDSQRMFRVFENLSNNITKYAQEGSRVYIDVINSMDKVDIILRNIAANEINFSVDEIMERFVRGDKSRNTEGSGLGLAIAKSFVELQGGKLHIVVDGDLFKVIITFHKKH
jgi:signal transduction histidine kinase